MPDFTYDLGTDIGKIRLRILDKDANKAVFTDDELQVFLDAEGGAWLLAAATAFGLLLGVFSTARTLPLAMLLVGFAGIAQAVYMALNNTLLQTIVPDQFRGRVMSVYMLCWGLMPLGTLPTGMIAQAYGAPVAVAIGGAICALFSLLTALGRPVLRQLD